jgi:hypothetical protein
MQQKICSALPVVKEIAYFNRRRSRLRTISTMYIIIKIQSASRLTQWRTVCYRLSTSTMPAFSLKGIVQPFELGGVTSLIQTACSKILQGRPLNFFFL